MAVILNSFDFSLSFVFMFYHVIYAITRNDFYGVWHKIKFMYQNLSLCSGRKWNFMFCTFPQLSFMLTTITRVFSRCNLVLAQQVLRLLYVFKQGFSGGYLSERISCGCIMFLCTHDQCILANKFLQRSRSALYQTDTKEQGIHGHIVRWRGVSHTHLSYFLCLTVYMFLLVWITDITKILGIGNASALCYVL